MRCNIPSLDEHICATKEEHIFWNVYESMQNPYPFQNEDLFKEHTYAIKVCTDAINSYNDPLQDHII